MQMCPLMAVRRIPQMLPIPMLHTSDDEKIDQLAGRPLTLGGALLLMASPNATAAAQLQKRLCQVLLYPRESCNFTSGAYTGPLFNRLDTSNGLMQQATEKLVTLAFTPVGAALRTLPDVLCKVPPKSLSQMPLQLKWQLVSFCTYYMPLLIRPVECELGVISLKPSQ